MQPALSLVKSNFLRKTGFITSLTIDDESASIFFEITPARSFTVLTLLNVNLTTF